MFGDVKNPGFKTDLSLLCIGYLQQKKFKNLKLS